MPLYRISGRDVQQIPPGRFPLESQLQRLVEANLDKLLGVRLIASEFSTGDRQRGRIDTLGLDYEGTPTIIEYKRSQKENIINQGLFYLDWLVDHKGDFILEAQKALGPKTDVSWDSPRLILIAETFSDYDKYAVNRIGANIELWVYRLYGEELLYLEPIFAPRPRSIQPSSEVVQAVEHDFEGIDLKDVTPLPTYDLDDHLAKSRPPIQEIFHLLREHILALVDDENEIAEIPNKLYITYRRGKNFAEVVFQAKALRVFLDIPPGEVNDPEGVTRDVSNVGHWGTGDIEVRLESSADVNRVMPFIEQAYRLTL